MVVLRNILIDVFPTKKFKSIFAITLHVNLRSIAANMLSFYSIVKSKPFLVL